MTRGYKDILIEKTTVPKHDEILDATKDSELIKTWNNSSWAYSNFILACEGEIGFVIVDEAVTGVLPEGDANMAWFLK